MQDRLPNLHQEHRHYVTEPPPPNRLYSYVKGMRCDCSGVAPLDAEDVAHRDPRMKNNIRNNVFNSVFSTEHITLSSPMEDTHNPDMHHFTVTVQEVKQPATEPRDTHSFWPRYTCKHAT